MIISELSEDSRERDYVEDVIRSAATSAETDAAGEKIEPETVQATDAEGKQFTLTNVNFEALWDINKDVVAWLTLPDTIIDYPVAQGETNDTYLRTLLNGEYHRFGTLFIDCDNDPNFNDFNTIIYGHHIKAGDMFCILEEFNSQKYYDEHPFFLLYTPDVIYRLEPYASRYVDYDYQVPRNFAGDPESYKEFIDYVMSNSLISPHVQMDENSNTVTMYTCAEDDKSQRFLVHCKVTVIG